MLRRAQPIADEVHLHLGAHKTATTYLQGALELNRARIADAGTVAILPRSARRLPAAAFSIPSNRTLDAWLRIATTRRAMRRLLERSGADAARRLVFSEENVSGSCGRILRTRRLYPLLARRLSGLPKGLLAGETTIHFAIRGYGPFFASCHSQLARHARSFPLAPIDRAGLAVLRRRWPHVVADLRRACPTARIRVWRYEEFDALEDEILTLLTGVPAGELIRPGGRPMGALSQTGMERLMAEEARRGAPLSPNDVRAIHDETEDGGRYDPWTGEEAAGLAAAYDEDWRTIADMDGVEALAA